MGYIIGHAYIVNFEYMIQHDSGSFQQMEN